jgi:methylmalonyl-CoA mutase
LPDRFGRRLARNTQLVLLLESNLGRVADPAAGSGGMEELTDQLAAAAWREFHEIESVGGVWAALETELLQRKIAAVRAQREAAIVCRKEVLVGTNEFADLQELPVATANAARVTMHLPDIKFAFQALPCVRLAQPFEELRDGSDLLLARNGTRPKVFLANLGPMSDFGARATFAANFFAAGGIEAPANEGFSDGNAMLTAFAASGRKLACICSSDEVYAREGARAARALREAGAQVWVAGQPGALAQTFADTGVSRFIFAGCDAIEALRAAHAIVAG